MVTNTHNGDQVLGKRTAIVLPTANIPCNQIEGFVSRGLPIGRE